MLSNIAHGKKKKRQAFSPVLLYSTVLYLAFPARLSPIYWLRAHAHTHVAHSHADGKLSYTPKRMHPKKSIRPQPANPARSKSNLFQRVNERALSKTPPSLSRRRGAIPQIDWLLARRRLPKAKSRGGFVMWSAGSGLYRQDVSRQLSPVPPLHLIPRPQGAPVYQIAEARGRNGQELAAKAARKRESSHSL